MFFILWWAVTCAANKTVLMEGQFHSFTSTVRKKMRNISKRKCISSCCRLLKHWPLSSQFGHPSTPVCVTTHFFLLKLKWSCNPCLSYELGLHMCWSWQMEMSSFGDVNQEIVKFCYLVYEEKKYMAFSLCEEMYSMSPYIVVTASSEHTVIKLWQQSSK